jgi:hypothetical protein
MGEELQLGGQDRRRRPPRRTEELSLESRIRGRLARGIPNLRNIISSILCTYLPALPIHPSSIPCIDLRLLLPLRPTTTRTPQPALLSHTACQPNLLRASLLIILSIRSLSQPLHNNLIRIKLLLPSSLPRQPRRPHPRLSRPTTSQTTLAIPLPFRINLLDPSQPLPPTSHAWKWISRWLLLPKLQVLKSRLPDPCHSIPRVDHSLLHPRPGSSSPLSLLSPAIIINLVHLPPLTPLPDSLLRQAPTHLTSPTSALPPPVLPTSSAPVLPPPPPPLAPCSRQPSLIPLPTLSTAPNPICRRSTCLNVPLPSPQLSRPSQTASPSPPNDRPCPPSARSSRMAHAS